MTETTATAQGFDAQVIMHGPHLVILQVSCCATTFSANDSSRAAAMHTDYHNSQFRRGNRRFPVR